jgi:hypothetical protein
MEWKVLVKNLVPKKNLLLAVTVTGFMVLLAALAPAAQAGGKPDKTDKPSNSVDKPSGSTDGSSNSGGSSTDNSTPVAPSSTSGSASTTNLVSSPFTFTGSDSFGRSASALFSLSGSNLIMQLLNDSSADSWVPTDVLTGLFFNLTGASLNPISAMLGEGSVIYDLATSSKNIGGEWAFGSKLNIGSTNYGYGVSAAGLGLFGPKDRFDTASNLAGTENIGGLDFGIVTAGDNPQTGNGGLDRNLIKGSTVFTFGLSNLTADFDLAKSLSNLRFQYGTNTSEPSFSGVLNNPVSNPTPEPPVVSNPNPPNPTTPEPPGGTPENPQTPEPPAPVIPPVVVDVSDPKPPTKPVEVPEPSTVFLALMSLGAFKLLKRQEDVKA